MGPTKCKKRECSLCDDLTHLIARTKDQIQKSAETEQKPPDKIPKTKKQKTSQHVSSSDDVERGSAMSDHWDEDGERWDWGRPSSSLTLPSLAFGRSANPNVAAQMDALLQATEEFWADQALMTDWFEGCHHQHQMPSDLDNTFYPLSMDTKRSGAEKRRAKHDSVVTRTGRTKKENSHRKYSSVSSLSFHHQSDHESTSRLNPLHFLLSSEKPAYGSKRASLSSSILEKSSDTAKNKDKDVVPATNLASNPSKHKSTWFQRSERWVHWTVVMSTAVVIAISFIIYLVYLVH